MQSRKTLFKYGTPFLVLGVLITAFIAVIGSPANAITPAAEEINVVMRMELEGVSLGTIQGDVTDAGHEGWIEILGYSHQVVSPRDAASGLPTGKRQHSPLRVTKYVDKASPLLFQALISNDVLTLVLHLGKLNEFGTMEDFFLIELDQASISSIQDQGGIGYGETVSFCYKQITWTYLDGGITATDNWEDPISN